MKKFIITESERNNIHKMYGLILEQNGGNLVPDIVYKAISDIESIYSYTDSDGTIKGGTYTGKEKESVCEKYIIDTIGLENWFKMDILLRAQIYSYMFQTDSKDGVRHNRWIAGLAQAIDNTINRGSILDKPIDNNDVQKAIQTIKNACKDGSINEVYDDYLKILDDQYSKTGSAHPDNYKNVWKYRPKALERLIIGNNKEDVFKDWGNQINQKIKESKQEIEINF